jgi:hypothetical protein
MMSTAPDQLREFGGVPVGGARYSSPWVQHWFVSAIDGSDSNDGKTVDSAKATIDAAVQLMGVGDVLYIRPQTYVVGTGHARYDEITTIDLAQSDLSIIGTGYPKNNEFGVRVRTSTAGYGFTVNGPSCHFENIGMIVGGTGTGNFIMNNNGATATQRGSDGPTFYNMHFKGGSDQVTGGQSPIFRNCRFHYATGTLTIATPAVSSYGLQMHDCNFLDNNGAQTTGPYIQAGGAHCYNVWINRCAFGQIPSGGKYMIFGGTLGTGLISHCFFNDPDVHVTNDITLNTLIDVVGCKDGSGADVA